MKTLAVEAHKILIDEPEGRRKIDLATAGNKTFKLWKVFSQMPEQHRMKKSWVKDFFLAFPEMFVLVNDLSGVPHVSAKR